MTKNKWKSRRRVPRQRVRSALQLAGGMVLCLALCSGTARAQASRSSWTQAPSDAPYDWSHAEEYRDLPSLDELMAGPFTFPPSSASASSKSAGPNSTDLPPLPTYTVQTPGYSARSASHDHQSHTTTGLNLGQKGTVPNEQELRQIMSQLNSDSQGLTSAHLSADRVEVDAEHNVTASGHVSVDLPAGRLLCNSLSIKQATGEITAAGDCVIYYNDNFVSAAWMTYNTKNRTAILHDVAGQGRSLSNDSDSFMGDILFWAETMEWSHDKMQLHNATLSTCDLPTEDMHFKIKSELMELDREKMLTMTNTKVCFKDLELPSIPTVNQSLGERGAGINSGFPRIGTNDDGLYIKTDWDYRFDENNHGTIRVDYYTKEGFGLGLNSSYSLGQRGRGKASFYNMGSPNTGHRYQISNTAYYMLSEDTMLAWRFSSNREDVIGGSKNRNLNSYTDITRHTDTSNLRFTHNISENSTQTSNTMWRLHYDVKLTRDLAALMDADISMASSLRRTTHRFHYAAGLRHESELFDSELMLENTQGSDTTYFFNRNPELTMRSHPVYLGDVPIIASASIGNVTEGPSLFRTTRTDLKLQIPDQMVEYDSGRFMLGGGARQQIYGSGEKQYSLAARAGWLQEMGDIASLRLDYNWFQPYGETPFQHDYYSSYHNVTGGLELRQHDKYALVFTSGYNLLNNQWQNVTARLEYQPWHNWKIAAGANFDPNTSTWHTLDTTLNMQLTDELSVAHWSVYDLFNKRMKYQDYQVNYESHDWVSSLIYRSIQNELYFQFAIKAFPHTDFRRIGTNSVDQIYSNPIEGLPRINYDTLAR